jgi:hypothetical protein
MTLTCVLRAAALSAGVALACALPAAAAPLATVVFPFAVGDSFTYLNAETDVVKTTKGTTTTPFAYSATTTIEPATVFNGLHAYPYHTTASYHEGTAAVTISDLEWRNFVPAGGRWYYSSYGYNYSTVSVKSPQVTEYITDKRTRATPFYYDVLPESPATFAEPVAEVESYDDYDQTTLGASNVLSYTETRSTDGSLTVSGMDYDVPYQHVVNSNGTGTDHAGPNQGGTLWAYGLPVKGASGYVIPATETYAGQMHTNDVPDWFPSHAAPAKPLAAAKIADLGTVVAPAGCGTRAGTPATLLAYSFNQLDPVNGDTYVETDDYYIVAGLGRICHLENTLETYYDQKVTGKVTETKSSASSEVLTSEHVVTPPPIVLSKSALTFTGLGSAAKQSFTVSEAGDVDPFTVSSSNPAVASVSPAVVADGGTIDVTPVGGGQATIVVTDASQETKSLTISVTAATLTLRDLPAGTASVRLTTVSGTKNSQSVIAAKPGSAVVSAGVLPGAVTLTLQAFSGTGATGTVLAKTSVATSFAAATQNVFDVSNANYLSYFHVPAAGIGSVTAGSAGDPDFYFLYGPSAAAHSIARMATTGAYTSYAENPVGDDSLAPGKAGSGLIWFASQAALGSHSTTGKTTFYKTTIGPCKAAYVPHSVALGPNGNPWYTEAGCGNAGIGTLAGGKPVDYLFPLDASKNPAYVLSSAAQHQIVTGHDGNVWFVAISCGPIGNPSCTGSTQYAIGRITPKGALTFLDLKIPVTCPTAYLAPGGDGNVWFVTCAAGGKTSTVVRITPARVSTAFAGVTTVANDIAEGPDGNLYITDNGEIARLVTTGSQIGRVDYYYPTANVPSLNSIGAGPDGLLYATNAGAFIDQIRPPSP